MRQENAAVLWTVCGFGFTFIVLVLAQPWWLVPVGMIGVILLSPLYVK